ncbi:helix-turn-helix domain-containing protein [Bdellovibrio sp.]|uniref:helix-turn-helix domain-containing protein n=1 Tax=Bdellovibrio sp. TaxID=28201 RepID=UPI0039E72AB3
MKSSSLAELLKEKRIAANLSQREVATRLGYTTAQFVSNWERGVSSPPVQMLKKIADLYRTSAEELFEAMLFTTLQKVQKDLRRKFNMVRR